MDNAPLRLGVFKQEKKHTCTFVVRGRVLALWERQY